MKSVLTNFVVLLFAVSLSGCSVLQPMPGGPSTWRNSVKAGDTVQVSTTDGKNLEFKVDEVTDSGLRGEGQAVDYDAISSLQKKSVSTWRTVALVALGVLAVGALAGGGGYGGGGGDYDSGGSGGGSGDGGGDGGGGGGDPYP
jgi:hypothetical protein